MRKCEQCIYYPHCDEYPFDESGCEDFKDRSRFVELPCKVGDHVFIIGGKYRGGQFDRWINTGNFRVSDLEKIGKTVFLAREEAEAALARMKG